MTLPNGDVVWVPLALVLDFWSVDGDCCDFTGWADTCVHGRLRGDCEIPAQVWELADEKLADCTSSFLRSIDDRGITEPLYVEWCVIEGTGTNGWPILRNGHHRVAAAEMLGYDAVPVYTFPDLERFLDAPGAYPAPISRPDERSDARTVERLENVRQLRAATLEAALVE